MIESIKKWELTKNTKVKFGRTFVQIRALRSFGVVTKGDLGGWIEEGSILSADAWMFEDAELFEGGEIRGGEIMGGRIMGGRIMGGIIYGGEIRGGVIWGGKIMGGIIRGGVIWGGKIMGGVIRGGVIRGGEIRGDALISGGEIIGGIVRGGEVRGGVIMGGTIHGGVISGGALIKSSDDIFGISPIGSENGYLLIYKKEAGFGVTRGCFSGSPKDFIDAVDKKYGRKKKAKIYKAALDLAALKFGKKFKKAMAGEK